MGNNMNCESCSRNTRSQMDMRGQRNNMTNRYSHRDCDGCHRDMDFLRGKPLAMAYVPWQEFGCTYEPMQGLQVGTIFPELDKPFLAYGRRGMK